MRTSSLISIILFCVSYTYAQSTWEVPAENINPDNYYGVTVANGMVGLVSSPDPLKVKDVILNGVYDYYQRGRVSNILKVFNHVNMDFAVDGNYINADNIQNYEQVLNMQEAALVTTFDVGPKVSVKSTMMSLRHLPYSSLHLIEVTAHADVEIMPISIIEAPDHIGDVRQLYQSIDRPHVRIPLMSSVGNSPSGAYKISATSSFIFDEDMHDQPHLIHEDWDYNRQFLKFKKKLKAGEKYRFSVVSSVCSSVTYQDPHNESERLNIYAILEGTDRLLERHKEAWTELWKSDVEITGDAQTTRDIRFALYHLYSFARAGTSFSLSPMGLSGLGYNGHVFWDTELWMYPPLLMLQPEIAKSLLNYRYERLEAAKQNAFAHGYDGAMYPWESAGDGSEDTPVWALTGPFEHHITGCVAWAFWKYYEVTQDIEWLEEKGWPVLSETAKYWASRVDRNGPRQYDINNVVAADEWAENVDNNAFTNAVAILNLRNATKAARILGKKVNTDWEHVAMNIPILKMKDGTTKEHASYNGEEIKQADVNLLAHPLNMIIDKDQIQKDLDYYEKVMSPTGPAMGFAILSILHNQMGNHEKAAKIFTSSYRDNEVPPFGVIAETAGGTNPYFATGAGGMLQAVLTGFGGLHFSENGIIQKASVIPQSWKKMIITGVGKDKQRYEVLAQDK